MTLENTSVICIFKYLAKQQVFFYNCAQMAGGDLFAAHTGQLSPSETEERQQTQGILEYAIP